MSPTSFGASTKAPLSSDQLRVLHGVAAAVDPAQDTPAILVAASEAAEKALGHSVLAFGVLDRRHGMLETWTVGASDEPRWQRHAMDSTGLGSVLADGTARVLRSPGSPVAPGCVSVAAAPLWVEGRRPGVLVVGSPAADWYTDEDLPLVEGLAGHVAVAVDRAHLRARENRRTRQLRLVSEVASAAVSTLETQVLLERVVERIQRRMGRAFTSLWLFDEPSGRLRLAARAGMTPLEPGLEQTTDQGILGRCFQSRRAVLVRDTRREPDYIAHPSFTGLSELCVPVTSRDRVLALINIEAEQPDAFDEEEATALQAVAGMCAAALENGELYGEVRSFNETLKEQLAEATSSLEEANREIAAQKALLEAENRSLKQRLDHSAESLEIVGSSRILRDVLEMAERVGSSEATCLIQGESGTGKELFARLIHRVSPRVDLPFVTVNCAAIPEDLLESTLFGHERGAFTGATRAQRGLVEAAHGGTLFLDEIGEMSPALQAKLLRFLQSGEYYRVGGTDLRTSDVRVVSATNRDLKAAVDEGVFRGDLFFRISTLVIDVPPLRMRADDIPVLVRHFLDRTERGRAMRPTPSLIAALEAYPWPGNVRELENVVARLVVLADGPELGPDLLSPQVIEEASLPPASASGKLREPSLILSLEEMEKAAVARALTRHDWDKKAAAADLGIALRTLYNKIHRFGLESQAPQTTRKG